ncbi:hypothetical protein MA16_Dca004574 [Dendrobium catenatum]|uniref:Uncharacterized protein n=1 Tax=Dendrobium catenatum TaxID=906689 RepID=A0A2I0VNH2_9ASPA|nr:hypothetical protein MA16_Dca004574 [Dendrobium catenatum]
MAGRLGSRARIARQRFGLVFLAVDLGKPSELEVRRRRPSEVGIGNSIFLLGSKTKKTRGQKVFFTFPSWSRDQQARSPFPDHDFKKKMRLVFVDWVDCTCLLMVLA